MREEEGEMPRAWVSELREHLRPGFIVNRIFGLYFVGSSEVP